MQKRSGSVSSPLRGYVARLFKRDMERSHQASESARSDVRPEVVPGLESLEQRLLLSASMGPISDQLLIRGSDDIPVVDAANFESQSLNVSNIKWRGEQVDAVQYEWIIRYSVDEQLSDAALNALAESLSPFAEIENMSADGFGVLTAPFPNMKGWQLNRWANNQDAVIYLEPNIVFSAASVPDDPAYTDKGLWGLLNNGASNDQIAMKYTITDDNSTPDNPYDDTGIFEELDNTSDLHYNPSFSEGVDISTTTIGGVDYDIEDLWTQSTGSRSVVVPVVDTGIDYTHPDLYMNIWINQGEIPSSIKSNLTDVDNDGLFTFYDLNDAQNAAYVVEQDGQNGRAEDGNDYIDAGDLLLTLQTTSSFEDGVDNDGNGFVDDLIGWDYFNNDNDPMDDAYHGTHVAGTIGAMGDNNLGVVGVNWDIQLMPQKILRYDAQGTYSGTLVGVVEAVHYTNHLKATGSANIVVENHSWGAWGVSTQYLQSMRDTLAESAQYDIVHVFAAHNRGLNIDIEGAFPAAFDLDNIISVAALEEDNTLAGFSNYGYVSVDLAAPGTHILSTTPVYSTDAMDNHKYAGTTTADPITPMYDLLSGTSMATPQVTGAVALLAAIEPTVSSMEIRSAILDSVTHVTALEEKVATEGRLNVYAAWQALSDNGPHVDYITPADYAGSTDEISIKFSQVILGSSVVSSNFALVRDGADNIFGTGDDVTLTPNTVVHSTDTVTLTYSANLPDDRYRLTLVATGANPLRGASSPYLSINGGEDYVHEFDIITTGFTESNQVVSEATETSLNGQGTYTVDGYIGDGPGYAYPWDVDMFHLQVDDGDTIEVAIDTPDNRTFDSYLRLFYYDSGQYTEVASNDDWDGFNSALKYEVTGGASGSYYIGVSAATNPTYSPTDPDGGTPAIYRDEPGEYELTVSVLNATTATDYVSGTIWHDIDGEGDQDEEGLSGWTVYIDDNHDGQFNDTYYTDTDINGNYLLEHPSVGDVSLDVRIVSRTGWETTTSSLVQTQTPDDIVTGVDFGVRISGDTFTVDTLLDHTSNRYSELGDMSLRQALALAGRYAGSNTIQFDDPGLSGGTIHLARKMNVLQMFYVSSDVEIQGLGADDLTIDADGSNFYGVIWVDHDVEVTMSGLSITGAISTSGTSSGEAAILNYGTLTANDLYINGNKSAGAGGIYNSDGAYLELANSTISNNLVYFGDKNMTSGGGIVNLGEMDLYNVTISGNETVGSGGGIMQLHKTGTSLPSATVVNSTISNNRADTSLESRDGGGIYVSGGTMTLHNTIVAGNFVGSGEYSTPDDIAGTFDSLSSYNFIGSATGSTGIQNNANGNQAGAFGAELNPGLAVLADYGGSMPTHALIYGSLAIDAGSDDLALDPDSNPLTTDQRGEDRTAYGSAAGSGQVDIGAYEWQPATIIVDKGGHVDDDDLSAGETTIREALEAAEDFDLAVIEFDSSLTNQNVYMGSGAELDINSDVIILGDTSNWDSMIFDGQQGSGGTTRIFNIASGVDASIRNVQIKNGSDSNGGGLQNAGTLLLEDVMVQNNVTSTYGGGIYNTSTGELTVRNSMLSGNDALIGGAIYNEGELVVERSSLLINTSYAAGGLANSSSGDADILNSTLAFNSSDTSAGGIVTSGNMKILNSTISTNSADVAGGGIYQSAGNLLIINSTITGNRADTDDSQGANDLGGGIYRSGSSTSTILFNTIVAENERGTSSPTDDDLSGTFNSGSMNNLIGVFSSGSGISDNVDGNMVGLTYSPNLGALASNGGPTLTHALQSGSDAIDMGSNIAANLILGLWDEWDEMDQRGDSYSRIVDGDGDQTDTVDIGAYEYVPA